MRFSLTGFGRPPRETWPTDRGVTWSRQPPPVDDDWDRQIKADVAAGRLDRLVEEAQADIASRCRPLAELLSEDSDEAAR